ncbi:hypothetical protein TB2_030231 [Malus domestica]
MGDRRRCSKAMQMTQYQARLDIEDAEMINAEAELANSLMQYEHHVESSHRGSVTGHSFVQHDREECHDRMMKDYFIERLRFPAHGSNKDINVLWSSPLFDDVVNGWAQKFRYKVNGNRYELSYYLTDEDEFIKIEEDSDEDMDDDQPTHVRTIARDVEYLAETTYEIQQDRVVLSEYMRHLNKIQAPQDHDTLHKDLVEHVWCREGER